MTEQPVFNLYLEETQSARIGRPAAYRLIMPDESGVLDSKYVERKTGLLLAWPCNPHSTGERMILSMLNCDYQHGINGAVTCPGFAPYEFAQPVTRRKITELAFSHKL
ncbi:MULTISPECIES: hypothetical protein [Mesorhizobium]|uniref:hypothetical protein n=1 Tax=Mesorhizobium TaxID=68287 RepID=UPI0007A93DF5|nr:MULTISPECIES: hypothetical protein [Mesorhizobium]AMX93680.1 hypothetical protein A4R28_11505 [Mesorhizobium ciceri]MDF3208375.1 hypothetical protein [Mesorhizobium sp. LMG15046]MDF3229054.1 hypothetical protein [Mesorhizobium sp. DSM 30133]RUU22168.1 hypothetical protein EOC84_03390 [Mesorhizobium sp. Primo-B]RUU37922.1 hypothetical protein EOC83_16825 [Mesorhizobium sp. Primo-A]